MGVLLMAGLWIIVLAWLVQLALMWKGNREIQLPFVLAYLLGVALLVADEYMASGGVSNYQLLTFIACLLVLVRMVTLKK